MRLQIRNALGEHREVLARVMELRVQMRQMPNPPEANDRSVAVWTVREATLNLGGGAAMRLQEWQQTFDLNAEMVQSMENRGAEALEVARVRFNDHYPLLQLQRYDDARTLLLHCRDVFERENATKQLGGVFSGLATLEDKLGHHEAAWRFARTAIRYTYAAGTPEGISISHRDLATCLTRVSADWRDVLGHRLAAAMVSGITESAGLQLSIAALAGDLRRAADHASAALPGDFASLCATVQQIEGVRFHELMQQLQPDETALNQLLQAVIAKAKELADTDDSASHVSGSHQGEEAQ